VFADKNISLKKAHDISEELENTLMAEYPGSSVTFHLDIDDAPELIDIRTRKKVENFGE
jgi:divalent metal cation (Fe/Co/Zn/Cd) transporter